MNTLEYNSLIGKKKVIELTSLSDTTLWRLERQGKFPKRKQISAKRVAWVAGEVLEWNEQRQKA